MDNLYNAATARATTNKTLFEMDEKLRIEWGGDLDSILASVHQFALAGKDRVQVMDSASIFHGGTDALNEKGNWIQDQLVGLGYTVYIQYYNHDLKYRMMVGW